MAMMDQSTLDRATAALVGVSIEPIHGTLVAVEGLGTLLVIHANHDLRFDKRVELEVGLLSEGLYACLFRKARIGHYVPTNEPDAQARFITWLNQFHGPFVGLNVCLAGFDEIYDYDFFEWGITQTSYERAAELVVRTVAETVTSVGVTLRLCCGVSRMGTDLAVERAASKLGIAVLNFSCKRFLPYCTDVGDIVVADVEDEYALLNAWVSQLLIVLGGRTHVYMRDLKFAQGAILIGDLVKLIGSGTPPQAFRNDGFVLNAARAYFDEHSEVIETVTLSEFLVLVQNTVVRCMHTNNL